MASVADAADANRFELTARVLDETGAPLAGVTVIAYGEGQAWAGGESTPIVDDYDEALEGSATRTDATGRFRFRGVLREEYWLELQLQGPRFLESPELYFESGGYGSPILEQGLQDLGDLTLQPAGALSGTVVDARGAAVAGARVELEDEWRGALYEDVYSDASGAFSLDHLLPGRYTLRLEASGFLAHARGGIEVTAREVSQLAALVLQDAVVLAGTLRDASGAPVPDNGVKASDDSGAEESWAYTDALGRFRLDLPHPGDYLVRAADDRVLGAEESSVDCTAPAEGAELTLPSHREFWLVVTRAESGAPLDDFTVEVDRYSLDAFRSYAAPMRYALGRHPPRGARRVLVGPKTTALGIRGADVVPTVTDLPSDLASDEVLEVRVRRGASLRGALATSSGSLRGSNVWLYLDDGRVTNDPRHADGSRWTSADASGAFEFRALESGDYRVSLSAENCLRRDVGPFHVDSAEPLDVGTFELQRGARVEVHCRVAPGPASCRALAQLRSQERRHSGQLDARGCVTFSGVAPGEYELSIDDIPGRFLQEEGVTITVPEDVELVVVDVDLTPFQPVTLELLAHAGGAPLRGVYAELYSADGSWDLYAGETDDTGRLLGDVPARGLGALTLRDERDLILAYVPLPDTPTESRLRLEVEATLGGLLLRLPPEATPPRDATTFVVLDAADFGGLPEREGLDRTEASFDAKRDAYVLDGIAAAEYAVRIEFCAENERDATVEPRLLARFTGTAVVKAGETTTCVLAPAP
ncbi:MAG: carboxypeptidase regulatory-like domain-containing protein [Planctomycetes bacterium]|nr:carboxypeptidase regulatory-like domain-containing protein [Planctomycetota bacterium]